MHWSKNPEIRQKTIIRLREKGLEWHKTHQNWNKGMKGFIHSGSFKKGHKINVGKPAGMLGKHQSDEAKKKIADYHKNHSNIGMFKKGQRPSIKTEFKKGHITWNTGKTGAFSKEALEKMSKSQRLRVGEKASNWHGGKVPENTKIRHSFEYKLWREAVFERDDYTCQNKNCLYCHNKKGGKLNAHHIKPFSKFPELRTSIENGITFCERCHNKTKNINQHTLKRDGGGKICNG